MIGYVYKMYLPNYNLVYFGITTKRLKYIYAKHRYRAKTSPSPVHKMFLELEAFDNIKFEIVQKVDYHSSCSSKSILQDLLKLQAEYIKKLEISNPLACMNKRVPKRTDKQRKEYVKNYIVNLNFI